VVNQLQEAPFTVWQRDPTLDLFLATSSSVFNQFPPPSSLNSAIIQNSEEAVRGIWQSSDRRYGILRNMGCIAQHLVVLRRIE
jgi:hypothetical protein